jgi:hypothetical protein
MLYNAVVLKSKKWQKTKSEAPQNAVGPMRCFGTPKNCVKRSEPNVDHERVLYAQGHVPWTR